MVCIDKPITQGLLGAILLLVLLNTLTYAWEGKVIGTPDGDSLRIKKGGQVSEVRLYGIDSPEYGQSCWQEAKALAKGLVMGKNVMVEPMDTDQYGRVVALVHYQGRIINRELVRNGMAWVYPRYCQAQPLCREMKALEQAARRQGVGVWREKAPMPPWLWRGRNNE